MFPMGKCDDIISTELFLLASNQFVFSQVEPLHLYTKQPYITTKHVTDFTHFVFILTCTSSLPSEKKKSPRCFRSHDLLSNVHYASLCLPFASCEVSLSQRKGHDHHFCLSSLFRGMKLKHRKDSHKGKKQSSEVTEDRKCCNSAERRTCREVKQKRDCVFHLETNKLMANNDYSSFLPKKHWVGWSHYSQS